MIGRLRVFFDAQFSSDEDDGWSADQRQLATAALLVEVALMDHEFDASELATLEKILLEKFNLPEDQLTELIRLAKEEQDHATSVYQFTQLINQHCNPGEKFELIAAMWQIAFADGNLDKYEEHLIRRVAELIYVSHSDFIRAKIIARDR